MGTNIKNLQSPTSTAGPTTLARPVGPAGGVVREGVAIGDAESTRFAEVLAKGAAAAPMTTLAVTPKPGSATLPLAGAKGASTASTASTKGAHVPNAARVTVDDPEGHARTGRSHRDDDPLDPRARHAAQMAPWGMTPMLPSSAPPADAAQVTSARGSLETLLPMLVKRVAWSQGDGKRRAMRLEIAEGHLAGGTLLVQAEGGRVHVRLDAPSHVDAEAWRARIEERLARRGIAVDAIEIGKS